MDVANVSFNQLKLIDKVLNQFDDICDIEVRTAKIINEDEWVFDENTIRFINYFITANIVPPQEKELVRHLQIQPTTLNDELVLDLNIERLEDSDLDYIDNYEEYHYKTNENSTEEYRDCYQWFVNDKGEKLINDINRYLDELEDKIVKELKEKGFKVVRITQNRVVEL